MSLEKRPLSCANMERAQKHSADDGGAEEIGSRQSLNNLGVTWAGLCPAASQTVIPASVSYGHSSFAGGIPRSSISKTHAVSVEKRPQGGGAVFPGASPDLGADA